MADTRAIPVEETLSPAYAKLPSYLDSAINVSVAEESTTTVSSSVVSEQDTSKSATASIPKDYSPPSVFDLLSRAASLLPARLRLSASAALFDWAHLTFQDRRTGHVDVQGFVQALREEAGVSISVSPRLIMRREEVGQSSFLAPSGAYLTWLRLMKDLSHE